MKLTPIFITAFLLLSLSSFSQKKRDILFKIDGTPHLVADFIKNYTKNIGIVVDSSQKQINNYLNLYIDYKLKVLEAQSLGLDTLETFKGEFSRYKQQLMTPYLKDTLVLKALIEEAYNRTKYEVNVSHILVRVDLQAKPEDTIKAYKKISEAHRLILDGKNFNEVAKKYSEDPSVKTNGGKIGYFRAFQMVYPFENVAYTTKKGALSKPFRTRFGYHILKVNNKRLSSGEVEVAHLMLKNKDSLSILKNKVKADSIYLLLKNGTPFADLVKKFSDDRGTASKGGVLPKFGLGKMIQPFADKSFALKSINSFSKPFKTTYGWHIVKLIKRYPVQDYELLKPELTKKVKKGARGKRIEQSIVNRLKKSYQITDYKAAFKVFGTKDWIKISDSLKMPLVKIQDSVFTQKDFVVYLKFKQLKKAISHTTYKQFRDRKVLDYYKSRLELTNPTYATSVNEFKEGLLLFDVMQNQVWEKSKKDSTGLKAYYVLNRNKYKKGFDKQKGIVINDYQNYLEQSWISSLRKKHLLEINKSALKKLIKKYK